MSGSENQGTAEYFSFVLEDEEFAIEIFKVREVLDCSEIIKIPQMPGFMRGVINLRGEVVPVVDLRRKLGMPAIEQTANTCTVIVEVEAEGEQIPIGLLVDGVQEVFTLECDQIKPPPRLGTKLNTDFIRGMGKRNGRFLILLDINRVFSDAELETISHSRQ